MARPASKHPTELELDILKVLWRQGACSVKQLQEALAPQRELAYTSVITMLTIMASKKYVDKRRLGSGHVYSASIKQSEAVGGILQDLIDRVYDGSRFAVMQQLLNTADLDANELAQIRKLIKAKSKEQS